MISWLMGHHPLVKILAEGQHKKNTVQDFETDPTLEKKRREFVHEAGLLSPQNLCGFPLESSMDEHDD